MTNYIMMQLGYCKDNVLVSFLDFLKNRALSRVGVRVGGYLSIVIS